jgi:hypothetical protein
MEKKFFFPPLEYFSLFTFSPFDPEYRSWLDLFLCIVIFVVTLAGEVEAGIITLFVICTLLTIRKTSKARVGLEIFFFSWCSH